MRRSGQIADAGALEEAEARSPQGPPAGRSDEEPKIAAAASKKHAAKKEMDKDKTVKEEKASTSSAAAAYKGDGEQGEDSCAYEDDEQGDKGLELAASTMAATRQFEAKAFPSPRMLRGAAKDKRPF